MSISVERNRHEQSGRAMHYRHDSQLFASVFAELEAPGGTLVITVDHEDGTVAWSILRRSGRSKRARRDLRGPSDFFPSGPRALRALGPQVGKMLAQMRQHEFKAY